MLDLVKHLYRTVRSLHEQFLLSEKALQHTLNTCRNKAELADTVLAMRETLEVCKDIEKRCNEIRRTCTSIYAMLASIDGELTTRTEYCTATLEFSQVLPVPSRHDKQAYNRLLEWLGVPKQLWENQEEPAVTVFWPGLVEYVTAWQSAGKPLPEFVDISRITSIENLRCVKRKNVLE